MTRGLIGKILGPTYDSQGSAGQLEYPGITFLVGGKKGVSGDRDEVVDSLVVKPKDGEMDIEGGLSRCKISVSSFTKLAVSQIELTYSLEEAFPYNSVLRHLSISS
jgi:hypothetical protein